MPAAVDLVLLPALERGKKLVHRFPGFIGAHTGFGGSHMRNAKFYHSVHSAVRRKLTIVETILAVILALAPISVRSVHLDSRAHRHSAALAIPFFHCPCSFHFWRLLCDMFLL
jgi:hypothetical protein